MSEGMGIAQILGMIALLILVLVFTYYATKFLAKGLGKRSLTLSTGQSVKSKIKLLGRIAVDRENSLLVILYDGREYLIGVGSGGFTVIASKEATDEQPDAKDMQTGGFAAWLQAALEKHVHREDGEKRP